MRNLSDSLLQAQKSPSRIPHVKVEVTNKIGGVVRLDWTKIYSGTEADYMYSAAMPGDGSLIRVRLTPPEDGNKLYRQRIDRPDPSSDFSVWEYTGQYGVLAAGCCSRGAEVSLFSSRAT